MALSRRQGRLYEDTVDIYVAPAPTVNVDKTVQDVAYPSQPTYPGVTCHFDSTPEVDVAAIQGLTKEVNIFTLDKFHFDASVDIQDTYCIHLKTPGHPQSGKYWIVQGNALVKVLHANKQTVYAKEGPKPAGIS